MTARRGPATHLHRSCSLGRSDAGPSRHTRGVSHSPSPSRRLRHGEGANGGRATSAAPSWLPPGLCAGRLRRRDVTPAHGATASSQGHSRRTPESAGAPASPAAGWRKAPPTSKLTDVACKARKFSQLPPRYGFAVHSTSGASLTSTSVQDYFPDLVFDYLEGCLVCSIRARTLSQLLGFR